MNRPILVSAPLATDLSGYSYPTIAARSGVVKYRGMWYHDPAEIAKWAEQDYQNTTRNLARREGRNTAVIALWTHGYTCAEVAKMFGVTPGRIGQIIGAR